MNQHFTTVLKEQEPELSDHFVFPDNQFKLPHYHLPSDYFSHPYSINQLERCREDYAKKQPCEAFEMEHFMGYGFEEQNYGNSGPFGQYKMEGVNYQHFLPIQPQWHLNNQILDENIKLEEQQEQKFWKHQIRDEISNQVENLYQKNYDPNLKFEENEPLNLKKVNEQLCRFIDVPYDDNGNKKNYRKQRVEAYLMKKHQRIFKKKIIYNCRKVVAENRFRYLGRFISLKQALQILMLPDDRAYSPLQIKQMLKNKNGPNKIQSEKMEQKLQ